MDTFVEAPGRRTRRRHSQEFKASVIEACRHPGVSIASVALANGLNANMLRKWLIDAERRDAGRVPLPVTSPPGAPGTVQAFMPVQLAAESLPEAPPEAPAADIRIELHKGPMRLTLTWPASRADECGAWLRELLR